MANEISERRRILFVAESVTLAHFARCVALAQMLDPTQYEVILASDPRYLPLVPEPRPFVFHAIKSIASVQFINALAKGQPVYDAETLAAYVDEDLRVLEDARPDLVIGDFRLSLAVSAPVAKIPYATIINAYWSPYARVHYPVPDLPFVRYLGLSLAQRLFDVVRPLAFALHARPLNRVRRQYGLPSLGHDLRQVYSWADHVLYPDIPEAVAMAPLPSNHHYIGPVLWSAEAALPDWWGQLPTDRPMVYVTLGSSGKVDLLPDVLEALANERVTVVASTAGKLEIPNPPSNAWLVDYLPGDKATAQADLVVCNGGSLTAYQALSFGKPVLGVTNNMDQMLNMQIVERLQAGVTLRADDRLTAAIMRETFQKVLNQPQMAASAQRCADLISQPRTRLNFNRCVTAVLG